MQCGQRDACGVALLEGGDTGRVIAAKAVTEDGDALGVNVRALGEIVESRRARHFVVGAARHVTDPSRLAHAGTVQCEGVNTATYELTAREKDAHLLSIVHAVYDDDRRRRKAIRGRLHE